MKTALARALVHDPPTSCWTSPPTAWTCWPRARCATRCAGCATSRASASSFPRTSCRRWSGCATRWWWCRTAAPWPGHGGRAVAASGESDFEETFVKLAFSAASARAHASAAGAHHDGRRLDRLPQGAADALRDRRTLLMVLLSSVAMGPLVLVLLSHAGGRHRKARRGARAGGAGHRARAHAAQLPRAPDLHRAAPPADYEQQLKDSKLGDPVLVVARTSRPTWPPARAAGGGGGQQRQPARAGGVRPCAAATAARLQPGTGHAAAGGARRGAGAAGGGAGRGARPGRPGHARRAADAPWCPSSC
jgi:hypothetical protein